MFGELFEFRRAKENFSRRAETSKRVCQSAVSILVGLLPVFRRFFFFSWPAAALRGRVLARSSPFDVEN